MVDLIVRVTWVGLIVGGSPVNPVIRPRQSPFAIISKLGKGAASMAVNRYDRSTCQK